MDKLLNLNTLLAEKIDEQIEKALLFWRLNALSSYDFVLLLPHDDVRLNAIMRTAFNAKLHHKLGFVVESRQASSLLALYSLYAFTDKIIVGSFDLPFGRKLRNLLDCGIASEEELINDVILGCMNEGAN